MRTLKICLTIFILIGFQFSIYYASSEGADETLSGELKDGTRVIVVTAYKYGFSPNPLVVKEGEKVKLIVTAMDVPHGIRIPEFHVNQVLPKGETQTAEFTASRRGQFMVHCSVYCGPDHGKQKTRLIVR